MAMPWNGVITPNADEATSANGPGGERVEKVLDNLVVCAAHQDSASKCDGDVRL